MAGGSAADRFDKRKILLATQYTPDRARNFHGLLIMSGKIRRSGTILAFAVVLGISNSFEMPTLNAFVPELVTRDEIQSAIAVDRAVFHGSRVVGPSLAGIFIGAWGAASAFFCNAFSFVALIIALFMIPPRSRGTAEEEQKRASGIKDGFRYVAKDKPSLAMIGLIAATTVFIFPIITVMMPLYVRLVLGLGADRLGLLMGASAVGSVIGAIFLISIPHRQTCAVHDGERRDCRMRDLRFIACAQFLPGDRAASSELARVGNELRISKHDCAGTRARLSARARLGCVHVELCWPHASRGIGSYRIIRSNRYAHGAGDCCGVLRCDCAVRACSRAPRMLATGSRRKAQRRNTGTARRRGCLA